MVMAVEVGCHFCLVFHIRCSKGVGRGKGGVKGEKRIIGKANSWKVRGKGKEREKAMETDRKEKAGK